MGEDHIAALAKRGNRYRRGVPELPQSFDRIVAGDVLDAGDSRWLVLVGRGHSPEHASLYCAERGILISGDMLLPRISTNVSVSANEPAGNPLRRFLDSLDDFADLPEETLVLPSHGLPFRGIAARVGQLRAHHDARLRELRTALEAAPRPLSAATSSRCSSAASSTSSSATSRWARRSPTSTFSGRRGKAHARVEADGAIRFAPP
jgi:glyoxylase-like metal-dependent hydrolase (beta-lactamase superfamily II)